MDVYGLKNHIISNSELIELVLEKTGFHNIDDSFGRGKEYRCARKAGRNPTSVKVNKQTLGATCFSTNLKGDLITLVQSKLMISFPQAIKKISEIVDYKFNITEDTYVPFGGYYKNIARLKNNLEVVDIEVYSDDILDQFQIMPNLLFYEDGILPEVQIKYKIGYDSVSGRIAVPWYSFDGQICGIMGRINRREVRDDETKWFPILPFPKSKTLYGFVENYNSIQEKSAIMIGESEKHSLQLSSKGLNIGVSLGGSFLSEIQSNNIKSLFPKKIFVMMDEGLNEEHSREIAKQLKVERYYKNKVYYVYDKNNIYLPKGSKMAPADLDKNSLSMLIKNCSIEV